jgi:hypothetical protein
VLRRRLRFDARAGRDVGIRPRAALARERQEMGGEQVGFERVVHVREGRSGVLREWSMAPLTLRLGGEIRRPIAYTGSDNHVVNKIDGEILRILQHDGRRSFTDIAAQVHLSANAVADRVKKLTRGLASFAASTLSSIRQRWA